MFLSTAAERHAFVHGVYAGFRTRPFNLKAPDLPDNDDVQEEPHYFKGGYIIGTLVQFGLTAAAIALGVGSL